MWNWGGHTLPCADRRVLSRRWPCPIDAGIRCAQRGGLLCSRSHDSDVLSRQGRDGCLSCWETWEPRAPAGASVDSKRARAAPGEGKQGRTGLSAGASCSPALLNGLMSQGRSPTSCPSRTPLGPIISYSSHWDPGFLLGSLQFFEFLLFSHPHIHPWEHKHDLQKKLN